MDARVPTSDFVSTNNMDVENSDSTLIHRLTKDMCDSKITGDTLNNQDSKNHNSTSELVSERKREMGDPKVTHVQETLILEDSVAMAKKFMEKISSQKCANSSNSEIVDVQKHVQICAQNLPKDVSQTDHVMDVEDESSSSQILDLDAIKVKMLSRLIETDAHFKSQQRGEPDLTAKQKYEVAYKKLDKSPVKFLSQFGKHLQLDDLDYFTQFKDQYEIDFYVKEIKKQFNKSSCAKIVNNRRFSAMEELLTAGDYFSEDEMKFRAPLLYEEMVGRYLTDDEIRERVDKTDLKFSSILLKHIDQLEENKIYYYQKHIQENQMEEGESDDDDEGKETVNESEESELESDEDGDEMTSGDKQIKIPPEKQQELKSEFLEIMKEKFLTGEDKHFFDYSTVDKNSDYDSLKTIEQDEQDKYFDDAEDFNSM